MTIKIYQGDSLSVLKTLPDRFVQCMVTSPPYLGLRNYGVLGQIGLEKNPEEYVEKMVVLFRELRRVLRDDGIVFLNLGDSYNGSGGAGGDYGPGGLREGQPKYPGRNVSGLKPKDLIGIPWRVAFALQADGWWLRNDIVWYKPNVMPSSATDRCTCCHEYIFLLTKSQRYFYDNEAIKEPSTSTQYDRTKRAAGRMTGSRYLLEGKGQKEAGQSLVIGTVTRNKRDVWTVTTKGFKGAHFAVFPEKLIEPCVLAGTSARGACPRCGAPWKRVVQRNNPSKEFNTGPDERYDGMSNMGGNHQTVDGLHRNGNGVYSSAITIGWLPTCTCDAGDPIPCVVMDIFSGSGTTGAVAKRLGRSYVGIELNPKYVEMSVERISGVAPQKIKDKDGREILCIQEPLFDDKIEVIKLEDLCPQETLLPETT